MTTAYRVVLADDHVLFRSGIKKIIHEMPGMEVVGEANDGLELLQMLKELEPDLVVLDISMPIIGGIEATREIRNLYPGTQILVLTMHRNKEYVHHAIASGANGYILKEDSDEELLSALKAIRKGETYVTQKLAGAVVNDLLRVALGKNHLTPYLLTLREREVLKLLVEAKPNAEISAILKISIRTVENHRANIMKKLKVKKTAEMVRYAIDHGLV